MKIRVSELEPNPFRRINQYPIEREKVEALKTSISETSFWDNMLVRKRNGKYQIAYGHHRLAALRELEVENVDVPVRELDDATMLRIMASENLEGWGTNPAVAIETVLATKEFLDGELAKCETWATSDKSIRGLFDSQRAYETAKGMGVGRETIQKFLGGNWKQSVIAEALATIKDKTIDRKAVEKLRSTIHATAFRAAVKEHNIPKEKQLAVAEEIATRDEGYRSVKTVVSEFADALGTTTKKKKKELEQKRLETEAAAIGKELNKVKDRLAMVHRWLKHAEEGNELDSFRRAALGMYNMLDSILSTIGKKKGEDDEKIKEVMVV